MALLTKGQILEVDDLPRQVVAVPEWGGEVMVRTLTAFENDAWEESLLGKGDERNLSNLRARFCALAICDEHGKRLFTEADCQALGARSTVALSRVYEVATKLSRTTEKDVDQLEKNSANGPDGGSHSG